MKLVADLHIHSHFSRATSRNLTFEHLARWAQLKGAHVVATGDIAHPGWLAEMRDKLAPAEDGLYRLKDEHTAAVQAQVPPACHDTVRFILGGEISNIYKRGDRTRKVHNLVFAPSFEALERLQARLEKIGNIRADGRPILGLDSRDLLEIVLETDPGCHLIPAHVWTPWFSLLGSKSGFDSVEECYADLAPHIFALETGLSSDPPMNWRVSALDRYALVSNSDAHSPEKLAREANLFNCELAYEALFEALMRRRGEASRPGPTDEIDASSGADTCVMGGVSRDASPLQGTIEFFPEEGKYHFDGHRACEVVWDPPTTLAHGGICPVCGKPVTVGVMHRVEELADRPTSSLPPRPQPFTSLIPLPEVLGEIHGVGPSSKKIDAEYMKLLGRLGPELVILRDAPLEEIAKAGGERLAEGIGRMRRGEVVAQPGYDGEYGVIRVFGATGRAAAQVGLFGGADDGPWTMDDGPRTDAPTKDEGPRTEDDRPTTADRGPLTADRRLTTDDRQPTTDDRQLTTDDRQPTTASFLHDAAPTQYAQRNTLLDALNAEQRAAVVCTDAPLVIVAGPGTGKTRTLTVRIAHLVRDLGVVPEAILAITFTNKAAGEMVERLESLLGKETAGRITIKTFHAFGVLLLRQHAARLGHSPQFAILAEEDRLALLRQACPELKANEAEDALAHISTAKNEVLGTRIDADNADKTPEGNPRSSALVRVPFADLLQRYDAALRAADAVDFDDLILLPIRLFEAHPDVLAAVRDRYRWISVDEYQDVNAAQYRLLRLLTAPSLPQPWGQQDHPPGLGDGGANLCVIGDPDQAIYGFRGADRRYFLRFEQDYPGARMLHLSRNYRSSQAILDAATQVIARNPDRKAVEILAEFADQVKLDIYRAPTDKAEAEYVVHQIEQMVGGTSYFSLDSARVTGETPDAARSFADFAVLYRLSALSRPLIEAFDRSGIPYQTVGQTSLYEYKAVREVLAHLWRLYNPRAPMLVGKVGNLSYQSDAPVARLIEQITAQLAAQQRKPYTETDAERLRQLALHAVPFGDRLGDFLEMTALRSETDTYDPRADRVTLMSIHASKGLEFPVVFIVGCEEGLLPYERVARSETGHSESEAPDVEEERRLFYVGLTRAGRKLVLTHARKRVLFGHFTENPPSRFVGDIAAALLEVQRMAYKPPEKKPEDAQLRLF
jgi:DNA helicase-2/ATP-dependent DNA helicase PcrA